MSVQKSSSHAGATCSHTFFTGKESRGIRAIIARRSVIAWRKAFGGVVGKVTFEDLESRVE